MEEMDKEITRKMTGAIQSLHKEFLKVRTGRANPAILDNVLADYYGNPTPISQVGNISVPDPQMILIAPWEKNMLGEIEKAILRSDLGMTPQNDGNTIRLPVPPLNEERRKEMVKQIKKYGEDAKLAIRNVRRDQNDKLKKLEKESEISKDDAKTMTHKVQTLTDEYVHQVGNLVLEKEKELLEL